MTKYSIIPPSYNADEFYNYLYDIAMNTKDTSRIPNIFYMELLEYFESVEDYERCAELQKQKDEKNKNNG
jgi:hypothetical protein